ncbi:MAG: ABC1 kinase family protein [Xenococcaceae cyanobacterium]
MIQAQLIWPPETSHELLRCYDADAIARYCHRHPWQTLWRSLRIIWAWGWFTCLLKWDQWTQQVEKNKSLRATQIRQIFTDLGPTFIKVGQALSIRPDLIRKDFLEELTLLQDQLPPFSTAEAFALIEAELGQPVDNIYEKISPQPVAAASIGQVYQGHLWSGEEVAIKVQRPGLVHRFTLDLYLIRRAAIWLGPRLPLHLGHDLALIVDEFGTKLFEELNYCNEARNAEQFAHNFQASDKVKVPAIYWAYTSTQVLTLEWIHGFKLTCNQCPVDANTSAVELSRIGVIAGLQQLLEFGFFHADPHPGNLFALTGGRIAYIDFGMMDHLDQATKETLVDAIIHLINKDYNLLAKDFVQLGFLTPETDIKPIVPALEAVFSDFTGGSVKDFNFHSITDRFSELMYDYPFRVPAKFAVIIRSLVIQEGVALCLNPNFKIVEVSYPYIAQRLLSGETPAFRRRLLEVLFKDDKFQWQRLESLLAIAHSDNSFDLASTLQLGLKSLVSEEGTELWRQLVLVLTENDRLHTDEVIRLWDLIKDNLQPQSLIDAALGVLAEWGRNR